MITKLLINRHYYKVDYTIFALCSKIDLYLESVDNLKPWQVLEDITSGDMVELCNMSLFTGRLDSIQVNKWHYQKCVPITGKSNTVYYKIISQLKHLTTL